MTYLAYSHGILNCGYSKMKGLQLHDLSLVTLRTCCRDKVGFGAQAEPKKQSQSKSFKNRAA